MLNTLAGSKWSTSAITSSFVDILVCFPDGYRAFKSRLVDIIVCFPDGYGAFKSRLVASLSMEQTMIPDQKVSLEIYNWIRLM